MHAAVQTHLKNGNIFSLGELDKYNPICESCGKERSNKASVHCEKATSRDL